MINRLITSLLQTRLATNPAVALVGPRQCGKTTLAYSLSHVCFDLEQESDRLRLDFKWTELITGNQLIVLDEAQTWPEVFPRLRGAIDATRSRNGRFLLLGSVSPVLMQHVSESLAGRLAIIELTPFLHPELLEQQITELWLYGGFPDGGIRSPNRFPHWQQDYITLLVQRDLPIWGLPAKPQVTLRLLRMLAAVHGQIWNASQIGQSLGLAYHTVNSYLDYLEGAFLIRRLPPWLPNLKKRLVRSYRVYWRDTGLLHALLGIHDLDDLLAQPWVGASWEGFVIHQVIGLLAAKGVFIEPHFFRTADGHEVDLVFKLRTHLWALEVKLSSNPSMQDFERFSKAADFIGAERRYLIAQVQHPMHSKGQGIVSLTDVLNIIAEELE